MERGCPIRWATPDFLFTVCKLNYSKYIKPTGTVSRPADFQNETLLSRSIWLRRVQTESGYFFQ